jgi:transcriptional regulator with XRE-family HTH domain
MYYLYVRCVMLIDEQKIIEEFGLRIKSLREARDWSQSDLSHEGDLDVGYIGKIERGQVNPGLIYIVKLARSFGMDVWELLKY